MNIKINAESSDDHLTHSGRSRMQHYFIRQFIALVFGFMVCTTLLAQQMEKIVAEKGIPPNSYLIHASDLLWKQELEVRNFVVQHPEALKSSTLLKTAWTFTVGSTKSWYADNLVTGLISDRYQVPSTCRAVGINCYIFVEDSSWITRVNQAAVDSIRIYFDSKTPANPSKGIFATDTSAFGNPPDVDQDPRIIILLLNIKDGYNGSGGFVGGYFQPFNEINPSQHGYSTSNFAEMFYIDTNPLKLTTSGGLTTGISTLAHEFQHMIHFHYDPTEISFVNEGCSVLAEVNCGFPIYSQSYYASEPNHYLLDWRSGDLTHVLNDYSRAARFFVYIRDQVGIGVFKKIVASTQHGTAGIDAGLQAYGSPLRFNGILQDWFIANILDDRSVDLLYGYSYPNLPKVLERTFFNPNVALTTDTVKNYAVQYLAFKSGSQLHATFTSSNSALIIKAVEIGSSKRVIDVTRNVDFTEPLFGTTYNEIHFVVMDTDPNIQVIYSYTASGTAVPQTDVQRVSIALPTSFMLKQNYPNPFNPSTNIEYSIPIKGIVKIEVFDILGHSVATLVDKVQDAGVYHTTWTGKANNGIAMPSGVYFYRLESGSFSKTERMLLLK
ncbi:MAG: T9SS type A sorting domain-containing protein [Ignavibacteriales bacterium]|nr:T9SS type A sorting domain-containing protein [Ignavibacteriales bacterium]